MNAFSQLFSGVGQIYLNVAFIICVFGILAFKPDRIARIPQFKLGCLLFSLSLVIPMIGALLPGDAFDSTSRAMQNNSALGTQISSLLSMAFYAGSFFTTVLSLLPMTTAIPSNK
jgi:hypothetical protein